MLEGDNRVDCWQS